MSRRHEDRELQIILRNVSAVVLLFLFAAIVLVSLVAPFISDRAADTTLVLGLAASIIGALPVLLGVQIALSRKPEDKEEKADD